VGFFESILSQAYFINWVLVCELSNLHYHLKPIMYFKLGTWVKTSTLIVAANNLLKTDCQRGAILAQVGYSVYGGLVWLGAVVALSAT